MLNKLSNNRTMDITGDGYIGQQGMDSACYRLRGSSLNG